MTPADVFVAVMLVLQLVASILYAVGGQFNWSIYWLGAFTINAAVLWRSLH
jgi:hypothetical protein